MAEAENRDPDDVLVRVLGDNLQTASLRLLLILAGASLVAGLITAVIV